MNAGKSSYNRLRCSANLLEYKLDFIRARNLMVRDQKFENPWNMISSSLQIPLSVSRKLINYRQVQIIGHQSTTSCRSGSSGCERIRSFMLVQIISTPFYSNDRSPSSRDAGDHVETASFASASAYRNLSIIRPPTDLSTPRRDNRTEHTSHERETRPWEWNATVKHFGGPFDFVAEHRTKRRKVLIGCDN